MNWWNSLLSKEGQNLTLKIVRNLQDLSKSQDIFPDPEQIFRCLDLVSNPKVVILGQDPYPTPGHANGLAFAVNAGCPIPRSLQNIFKELKDDLGQIHTDRTLLSWVDQGVVLLNSTLTVESGKPGSHRSLGWELITNEIIVHLSKNVDHLAFVLWGRHAQEKTPLIDSSKHFIVASPHPSPLSASQGFFGSKPFSKINQYLYDQNLPTVVW